MRFSGTVAICALLVAVVCTDARAQKSADLSQIVALLQQHDNALNQHDLDGIMSVFAPTQNIVVLGTGPGERWSGRDEIRGAYTEIIKDFDRGTATRECYWKTGEIIENTAWVAAMCKFADSKDGKKREYELNVSGVLRRIGGKWYFQSLHFSNLTGGGGN